MAGARFERIEGVADREPLLPETPADARQRRVAIMLLDRQIIDQAAERSRGGITTPDQKNILRMLNRTDRPVGSSRSGA